MALCFQFLIQPISFLSPPILKIRKNSSSLMSKFLLFVYFLQSFLLVFEAQQKYENNHQLDCDDWDISTKGYTCNGLQSSCQAYVTFRSNPPYNSPATIGYLLGTQQDSTLIASINNISSDITTIPNDKLVIVPVKCSCYRGLYYQHNASYIIKNEDENYFTLANDTYQGLTTCQAFRIQNPFDMMDLQKGMNLRVPIRCACPTANQTALGAKFMLTYIADWEDYIESIAEKFNADEQSVLDANELQEESIIYPFNPILVPLTKDPSRIEVKESPPPPPRPPQLTITSVTTESKSSKKVLIVGVIIGPSLVFLVALSSFLFWYFNCCLFKQNNSNTKSLPEPHDVSLPLSSIAIEYAVECLVVYKYSDILSATGFFSEENRINGSVYKGVFKGDFAAVKVMEGDVSSEINFFKKINHRNVIRLSGFCVHEGNTCLVYEHANNGSLDYWIHGKKQEDFITLPWKKRLQIAYDVAHALSYLHNNTDLPCVHKNLTTSNILLDGEFRAKISNFGLAKTLKVNGDDNQEAAHLTTHVVGTYGYMAPEYIEDGLITPKFDVFAYGVVVLELLSGKEAVVRKENGGVELLSALINQVLEEDSNVREKLVGFIDPSLREELPLHEAFSVAQLGKQCVAHDLNARPNMSQVFSTLYKIVSSSLD